MVCFGRPFVFSFSHFLHSYFMFKVKKNRDKLFIEQVFKIGLQDKNHKIQMTDQSNRSNPRDSDLCFEQYR